MNFLNYFSQPTNPPPGPIDGYGANPFSRSGFHIIETGTNKNSQQLTLQRCIPIHWRPREWTASGFISGTDSITLAEIQSATAEFEIIDGISTLYVEAFPRCDSADPLTANYWAGIRAVIDVPVTYGGDPGGSVAYVTNKTDGVEYEEAPGGIAVTCGDDSFTLKLYRQADITPPDEWPTVDIELTATDLFF